MKLSRYRPYFDVNKKTPEFNVKSKASVVIFALVYSLIFAL